MAGSCPPRPTKAGPDAVRHSPQLACFRGVVRGRPCVPDPDTGCVRLDLAGRRAGAAAVLHGSGPLRGGPASRRRHRRRDRPPRPRTGRRHCLLRRLRARRGPRGHDHDRRRLRRHLAAARRDERRARPRGHRGERDRQCRREQRPGHPAAACSPGSTRRRGPERIRRPARLAARSTAHTAATGGRSTGARGGSSRSRPDRKRPIGSRRAGRPGRGRTPARAAASGTGAGRRGSARPEAVRSAGRPRAGGAAAGATPDERRALQEGAPFDPGAGAFAGHRAGCRGCCRSPGTTGGCATLARADIPARSRTPAGAGRGSRSGGGRDVARCGTHRLRPVFPTSGASARTIERWQRAAKLAGPRDDCHGCTRVGSVARPSSLPRQPRRARGRSYDESP